MLQGVTTYVEECETAVASLSDVFEVDAEGEDVTWGMLAEMFDVFADAFGQLSPPQELQAYHDATLNAMEAVRDHARTRPSDDSFLEEFVPIVLDVLGASLEMAFDQTKTEEEKERAIEDLLTEKLGGLFGPDYVTAALAQGEARERLSEEMLALLDSSGCGEIFAAAPGDDQPIASDASDDHGDDIRSATAAAVGSYFEAALVYVGDVDYFAFQAEEGERYQIDIELWTLGDSELTLYDAGGWELAYNDDYGDSLASRIIWEAPSAGEYYIAVSGWDAAGTYALTIGLSGGIADDHGDNIGSATAAAVGSYFEAALDYDGDVDYFAFQAEEGERYQIDVDLLTLGDSELTLYDAGGREVAYNDDYGDSLASRIVWEAPSAGEYYIVVSGWGAAGTYALTIGLSDTQAGSSGSRASTQGLTQLTDNSDLDWFPAWSPDGSSIAFSSERDGDAELYVMNADGSGVTQLTNNFDADWLPAWSPDGSRIAFASDRDGDGELYVMNADGSGVNRLTDNPADDWFAAWSPDGSSIVFSSDRDGDAELYVMNADGSGVMQLTDDSDDDFSAAWSPDGSRIAFASYRDGDYELYVINADGSGVIRLTDNSANDFHPAWSPDGSSIVFSSDRDGDAELYVMNADGSGVMQLTDNSDDDFSAAWSPDGSRIVFTSDRDGDYELYVLNIDG